jgi:uncharacterized protein (DUF1015 family)
MTTIRPLRGLRFNPERVPDISTVIAPPYDVISPPQREWYHKSDPHNVVRLILPVAPPQVAHSDRYDMAAQYLASWIEQDILVEDSEPAIYTMDCEFIHDGRTYVRRSFVAAVKLEEPGKGSIFPHEETTHGPKADRLALLEATRTNLSPIFALYPDDGAVMSIIESAPQSEPLCVAVDRDDVRTTLRAITDAATIAKLQSEFESRPLLIADGHHRYETALQYRDAHQGDEGADYIMIACTSYLDPALLVLPAHRVAKTNGNFNMEKMLKKAETNFHVSRLHAGDAHPADVLLNGIARFDRHAYGLYGPDGEMALLQLRDDSLADQNPAPHSQDWKQLETATMHWFILHDLLDIDDDDSRTAEQVNYVRDASEAIEMVEQNEFDIAVLLKPTRVSQTRRVAELNERMPPKSTYFSPKLPSGLVLRRL